MNLFFCGGILTRCRRLCKSLDVSDAADLTWKRLAGDSLEVNNEVFQTRPALEIICSKGVLMHDSIEADESTIVEKLKCGTFVQVMSPPVQAGDRTRRAVRYGGRDGYVTTVGNLGSVYCKERYALVHEAAKTKIAEDHIEEHAIIAVEEDALEQKISNTTSRTFRAKTSRPRAVTKDSGAIGVTKKTGPRRSCVDAKIRFLKSSQSPDMLIPKAAFTRLIRELVTDPRIFSCFSDNHVVGNPGFENALV